MLVSGRVPHATTILDNTHISAAQTLFDQNKPPGKTITYSGRERTTGLWIFTFGEVVLLPGEGE